MKTDYNIFNNSILQVEHKQNVIVFSNLKEFFEPVKATGFSIKYVINGTEVYHLNNEKHIVNSGQYLLSNLEKVGNVEIESKQKVKGICISLDKNLIAEIVTKTIEVNSTSNNTELSNFLITDNFLDNTYNNKNTLAGSMLNQVSDLAQNEILTKDNFTEEFFYSLGEKIVEDQIPVFKQLQNIPTKRVQTKNDLFRKVAIAKEFIDCEFLQPLQVSDMSKEACISEYHFYRLFKQIHNITPLQYVINKRLELAKEIIIKENLSITETALQCGFTDVFSFSKSFKKYFKVSPSHLNKL